MPHYESPGVYVEEVPSSVRTITGVSTSHTAFVDWFPRGPVNKATRVNSFGAFARVFGGLNALSEASYAIRQYFLNGGSVAWVVRIASGATTATSADLADHADDTLIIAASSPGLWGAGLLLTIKHQGSLFDLTVEEKDGEKTLASETFTGLALDPTSAQYCLPKINRSSQLIQVTAASGTGLPEVATAEALATPGTDGTVPPAAGWAAEPAFTNGGNAESRLGIYALLDIAPEVFNLLCLPAAKRFTAAAAGNVYDHATTFCSAVRAFLLMDPAPGMATQAELKLPAFDSHRDKNSALYFPELTVSDPLSVTGSRTIGPSGTVAGVIARTDANRGVWKAPAGTDAGIKAATPDASLTDGEGGALNKRGINALRTFPVYGHVVWGARTLKGSDYDASEWKYVPVRRTALFIEESLFQGLKWVVFEPNDEPLWSQIRLNVGAFMQNLFRQGAFQGKSPKEAYFVKCDAETTTQNDIDLGIVNILVGFAPLKPAEFVVIKLQQLAGQIAV